jgi:lambda family phage portal protein
VSTAPLKIDPRGSVVLQRWLAERQLERALAQRAQKQMRRSAPFALTSGFAGAEISRLTASLAQWSGAVNADLDAALVILRARARQLCANSEYAKRFLGLVARNVVGPCGPMLQVRAMLSGRGGLDKAANDAIETHWARWCQAADLRGQMGLAQMLRVNLKAVVRDGEGLLRKVRRRDLPYGFALQLLEADRLDERINQLLPNGNVIRLGVESTSEGRPVALWLRSSHPGENYQQRPPTPERVDARDIYHVFLHERAEQTRGYTWLHAVLKRMGMLDAYEEAAVVAARVGASKMGFFTRDPDKSSELGLEQMADAKDDAGTLQMSAEPGEFVELPVGWELQAFEPDYPHQNFDAFLKACLRGVASGLDVATHNLTGDMTDVNYSSARIAELAEREVWRELQDWYLNGLVYRIFRDWLELALLRGDVTFPDSGKALPATTLDKFANAASFQGRRWGWVDPMNESKSAALALENRLTSRTRLMAEQGLDFDSTLAELEQEDAAIKDAGLAVSPTPATVANPKPEAAGAESQPAED